MCVLCVDTPLLGDSQQTAGKSREMKSRVREEKRPVRLPLETSSSFILQQKKRRKTSGDEHTIFIQT